MRKKQELEIDTPFLFDYISKEISKHHPAKKRISYTGGDSVPLQLKFLKRLWKLIPETFLSATSYGSYEFTADRLKNLCSLAENYRLYELACHILQPRYRSHHTHSMLVGVLGWWALNNMCYKGEKLLDKYQRLLNIYSLGAAYKVWDVWWLVALCHDMGYSVSLIWKRMPLLLDMAYQYGANFGPILRQLESLRPPANTNSYNKEFHSDVEGVLKKIIVMAKDDISSSCIGCYDELRELIKNAQHDWMISFLPKVEHRLVIQDNFWSDSPTYKEIILSVLKNEGELGPKKDNLKDLDHGVISAHMVQMQLADSASSSHFSPTGVVAMMLTPIALHNIYKIPKIAVSSGTDPEVVPLRWTDSGAK